MTDAAPRPILEASDITAGYGEVEILHGVSVQVRPGEMVSIIGPNGAGKSTLLKVLFGLVKPQSGVVRLEEREITGSEPDRLVQLGMGYVPQVENVFASLSVRENLEMGAYARSNGTAKRMQDVYALFPLLAERRNQRAGSLSGGQRQLLALARALMLDPKLLLLDEPSASLSPRMVDLVFEKIGEINASGTSILMVEQNARHALSVSKRAYVMATGENRLEGEAGQVLNSEEVRRLYMGE